MHILPWRRDEDAGRVPRTINDLMSSLWTDGQFPAAEHLPEFFRGKGFPPVNVTESEEGYAVTVDCPGLEDDDFEVRAMGGRLHIAGERRWNEEVEDEGLHRVESQFGRFERSVPLPEDAVLDSDAIDARYRKGVLTVHVPKREPTPARKIHVKGAD